MWVINGECEQPLCRRKLLMELYLKSLCRLTLQSPGESWCWLWAEHEIIQCGVFSLSLPESICQSRDANRASRSCIRTLSLSGWRLFSRMLLEAVFVFYILWLWQWHWLILSFRLLWSKHPHGSRRSMVVMGPCVLLRVILGLPVFVSTVVCVFIIGNLTPSRFFLWCDTLCTKLQTLQVLVWYLFSVMKRWCTAGTNAPHILYVVN